MKPTFSVVAKAHFRLPKANGIFTLTDAIELLELGLVDALHKLDQYALNGCYASLELFYSLGWESKAQWL